MTDSAATRPPDAALRATRVIAVSSARLPSARAVVRDQIKEFASTRIMFSSAPKMIILDEADNMTSAAQSALRRVIEKYTKNARFCLICNYASKIIPALQSRCTRFRFAPLAPEQARTRLGEVARQEAVDSTDEGLDACVTLGLGDMRKCLNILQSTHMAFAHVDVKNVYQCTGSPMPDDVEAIVRWLLQEEFDSCFDNCWRTMSEKGLALSDVLTKIAEFVVTLEVKEPIHVARLLASLSDLELRLSVGTNEKIQLAGLVGLFLQYRPGLVSVEAA